MRSSAFDPEQQQRKAQADEGDHGDSRRRAVVLRATKNSGLARSTSNNGCITAIATRPRGAAAALAGDRMPLP